jgi:hypothetical protein
MHLECLLWSVPSRERFCLGSWRRWFQRRGTWIWSYCSWRSQCAQPDDRSRHAGLRPHPMTGRPRGETHRRPIRVPARSGAAIAVVVAITAPSVLKLVSAASFLRMQIGQSRLSCDPPSGGVRGCFGVMTHRKFGRRWCEGGRSAMSRGGCSGAGSRPTRSSVTVIQGTRLATPPRCAC